MRLRSLVAWWAVTIASVQAQDALLALAKHMPKCSLACFSQELPKSTCATNLTPQCLCTNTALNAAVAVCAKKTCTVYELLQTKNVSSNACGVPVRNKGRKFLIIAVVGIVIAILAFILRTMASLGKRKRQMSWDDATMGIVVLLAIPPAVFAPFLVNNGLGRDIWTLQPEQITNVLKYYYLGEIFYVVALGISKISILCFYLRVFPSQGFRAMAFGVMGLSVAYTIAFFFATTFQCTPISFAWTQWDGLHKGKCNNIHLQGWIAAAINIVLDGIVMGLPLRHLSQLNMGLKKKIMIMAMFSVGILVIVVSIIRMYSLIHFANTENITWNYVDAGYWSLIEVDVSIICGCMPAHRALIAKMWPKIRTTFRGDSTNKSKSDISGASHSTGTNKLNKISIKHKAEDEADFVPLVDVDTQGGRTRLENEACSNGKLGGWITQTSTVEVSSTNMPATEQAVPKTSHDWDNMGRPATRKEHI